MNASKYTILRRKWGNFFLKLKLTSHINIVHSRILEWIRINDNVTNYKDRRCRKWHSAWVLYIQYSKHYCKLQSLSRLKNDYSWNLSSILSKIFKICHNFVIFVGLHYNLSWQWQWYKWQGQNDVLCDGKILILCRTWPTYLVWVLSEHKYTYYQSHRCKYMYSSSDAFINTD